MKPTLLILNGCDDLVEERLAPWFHLIKWPLNQEELSVISVDLFDSNRSIHGLIHPSMSEETAPEVRMRQQQQLNELQQHYPSIAIISQKLLLTPETREAFFTHVFLVARFFEVKETLSLKALMLFHSQQKYLYFCYNQSIKDRLGQIVANHEKDSLDTVFQSYQEKLIELLASTPSVKNRTNAFQHVFGYLSKEMGTEERTQLLHQIDDYRQGREKGSQTLVTQKLREEVIRVNQTFLLPQSIFEPYPEDLEAIFMNIKNDPL